MSLVLDSSVTLAWIYAEETTDAIRVLFDQVADAGAYVPSPWRLEFANSLTVAVRCMRIDAKFRRAADPQTDAHAWGETLTLANRLVARPQQKSHASAFASDKGNHRDYLARETHEQPEVVARTLAHYLDMSAAAVRLHFDPAGPIDTRIDLC